MGYVFYNYRLSNVSKDNEYKMSEEALIAATTIESQNQNPKIKNEKQISFDQLPASLQVFVPEEQKQLAGASSVTFEDNTTGYKVSYSYNLDLVSANRRLFPLASSKGYNIIDLAKTENTAAFVAEDSKFVVAANLSTEDQKVTSVIIVARSK